MELPLGLPGQPRSAPRQVNVVKSLSYTYIVAAALRLLNAPVEIVSTSWTTQGRAKLI